MLFGRYLRIFSKCAVLAFDLIHNCSQFTVIVRALRGFTREIFAGNLFFGLKHTLYLPDHDSGGWTPSNYFSGASSQSLVIAFLGALYMSKFRPA